MSKKRHQKQKSGSRSAARTSWDPLAEWYDGWVGKGGSRFHRKVAIPAVMELLDVQPDERVLDVGAGQGVLSQFVHEAGGAYTGVDASSKLLAQARKYHGDYARFVLGDARKLTSLPGINKTAFDAVVFLLSIQDMDPLLPVLKSAAQTLRPGGRAVLLMTHPAFRIPRQSGWGWDEGRKLRYRRIDRYLTPLPIPMKAYPGAQGVSRTFHRPVSVYVNALADCGLLVEQMREIPTYETSKSAAETFADQEIPLFLGLRARKPAEQWAQQSADAP